VSKNFSELAPCEDSFSEKWFRENKSWIDSHHHSHLKKEAMLVLSGETLQVLEGRVYICRPGTLFLINQHDRHNTFYSSHASGIHLWLFFLPTSVSCNIFDCNGQRPLLLRHYSISDHNITERLSEVWSKIDESPSYVAQLESIFREIFCQIYRFLTNATASSDQTKDPMLAIQNYLRENSGKYSDIETLSQMAGCCRQHFMRKFKKFSNCTVKQYINMVRIYRYEELADSCSVKELADALGFESSSAFCHWREKQKLPKKLSDYSFGDETEKPKRGSK
jgi:AraC-like DNA-binding protein